MVGRSIADISDLRHHIYWGMKRRGKYAADDIEAVDLLPYYIWYIIWWVRNRQTFWCEMAKYFQNDTTFRSEVDMTYNEPCRNT